MDNDWTKVLASPAIGSISMRSMNATSVRLWVQRKRGNQICDVRFVGGEWGVHEVIERRYGSAVLQVPHSRGTVSATVSGLWVNGADAAVAEQGALHQAVRGFWGVRVAPRRQVARRMAFERPCSIDLRYLERCEAQRRKPVLRQIGVDEIYQGRRTSS
jgi:hypothetical protein